VTSRRPAVAADPVEPLRQRIQTVLDGFIGRQSETLAEVGPELGDLIDTATDLLSGGKRLRPAFCYWGWRGAGGEDGDQIVTAAAALELFQAAALVHDDLIDASDTRRGRPSVHARLAALHRESGWAGDSGAFGSAGAILLGDLLLGWSDELLGGSGQDDEQLARARPVYERMRTEVGAGQYLDVLAQARRADPPEHRADRAHRVIRAKAARYSVEQPLLLGGRAAGARPDLLAGYSAYGLAIGEAYQLRDDVLGVFGDPEATGKPAGDDLREGKQTLLLTYAAMHADRDQSRTLEGLVGDPGMTPAGVAELRAIITDTGALDRVEGLITERVEQAHAALEATGLVPEAHGALQSLIKAATARAS
jgi:geranylgeranyl diphosphate synthase type I